MLKAGDVRLLLSRSICSGKYMVLIGGDTAAVTAAVEAGCEAAGGCLIDSFVIPNIHPASSSRSAARNQRSRTGALGVIESFNVATLIQAADAVAKTSTVQLLEVRLAMAMGGKAFCSMTGDVSSVQAGVAAGRAVLAEAGVLVKQRRHFPPASRRVSRNRLIFRRIVSAMPARMPMTAAVFQPFGHKKAVRITRERRCLALRGLIKSAQASKDFPQPQLCFAFGLEILNRRRQGVAEIHDCAAKILRADHINPK